MIELPPAVIGDVDDLDAVIERDLGVFRGTDAFDAERNLLFALHALDGAPIKRHLELAPVARRRPPVVWRLARSRSRRL